MFRCAFCGAVRLNGEAQRRSEPTSLITLRLLCTGSIDFVKGGRGVFLPFQGGISPPRAGRGGGNPPGGVPRGGIFHFWGGPDSGEFWDSGNPECHTFPRNV